MNGNSSDALLFEIYFRDEHHVTARILAKNLFATVFSVFIASEDEQRDRVFIENLFGLRTLHPKDQPIYQSGTSAHPLGARTQHEREGTDHKVEQSAKDFFGGRGWIDPLGAFRRRNRLAVFSWRHDLIAEPFGGPI